MGKSMYRKMMDGELPLPNVALTLGASIIETAPEKGAIVMTYEGKPEFTNPVGNIQGGMLAAMLDDTMAIALLATLGENEFAPTLELKINFISPAKIGKLTGRGKVLSKGSRVGVIEGELWQEEKLVAKATATALILKKEGP